jgi:drug/metabolite transporter (DMT)-like permease
MSSKIKLYLLLIFTHILFGINYSTNKVVLNVIDPFVWTTIRFLLAGVVLLTITLSLKRKHPSLIKNFFYHFSYFL